MNNYPVRFYLPLSLLGAIAFTTFSPFPVATKEMVMAAEIVSFAIAQSPSANQEGWELYNTEEYEKAAKKFLEATQEEPNNPKPYWGLTLTYNKLQQYPEALQALNQAVAVDPETTFTSKETYNKILKILEGKVSQNLRNGFPENIVAILKDNPAYIASDMSLVADTVRLSQVARELEPFTVKLAVLSTVEGDRQDYAQKLFEYLNLENAALIVATQQGVDLYSDRIPPEIAIELAKQSRVEFTQTNYSPGLATLAQSAATQIQQTEKSRTGFLVGIVGLVAAGGAGVTLYNRKRWKGSIEALKSQRQQVADHLEDVEQTIHVLPDNEAARNAQLAYQEASDKFVQASDIVDKPNSTSKQIRQATGLLNWSSQSLRQARQFIDSAMGITPPSENSTVSPDYAVCFFCSRPIAIAEAQVTNIRGQNLQQRVLACSTCATQHDSGRMPKVRSVKQGNRYVPWYRSSSYNPYQDYYSYRHDWDLMDIDEIEIEINENDIENILIVPDQPQYREQCVQALEQEINWSGRNFISNDYDAGSEESESETNFLWAESESEELVESEGETDFLETDPS